MKEESKLGDELRGALDKSPDVMKELMQEYIDKKDLNDRVKIKFRMKALLDLAGADTIYPKPAKIDKNSMGGVIGGGLGMMPPPLPYGDDLGGRRVAPIEPGGDIQPVPGAEPVGLNNDDIAPTA